MAEYKISKEHFFVNPYNFVPVDLEHTRRSSVHQCHEELLTGYLDCHIKCKTHLAIPDVTNREPKEKREKQHYKYPFMGMQQGSPYIPGSSLRGVVRNVYETITDSCFGTMQKDTIVTVRSKKSFRAGLIVEENGNWQLYRAEKYLLVTDRNFQREEGIQNYHNLKSLKYQSGDLLHFKVAYDKEGHIKEYHKKGFPIGKYAKCVCKEADMTTKSGYLCIGERSPKRHFQGIFEKKELEKKHSEFTKEDFTRLESVLEVYRNRSINKMYKEKHFGYSAYERMKKNGVIPVYYDIDKNGKFYVSFAALGRKAFQTTLDQAISEKSHQKCNDRENLCPACTLFGTAEGKGLGSRVRFTDAKCIDFDEKKQLIQNVVFAELSTPRISYIPFYLREKVHNANFTSGYDSEELEVRGRKFYWHHIPELWPEMPIKKTDRNGTYDVVMPDTEFKFQVYFERITEEELKLLATAIHLNENDIEGKLCQKLGHGKPLGYGSVKMTVDNCIVRKFDASSGWSEEMKELSSEKECYTCSRETWEALKFISCFDACESWGDVKVEYPSISTEHLVEGEKAGFKENDLANHKWFTANYSLGGKRPKYLLPEITGAQPFAKYEILKENLYQKKGFHSKGDKRR